eukprot:14692034-Alexandrium_andersonii.AAC.1
MSGTFKSHAWQVSSAARPPPSCQGNGFEVRRLLRERLRRQISGGVAAELQETILGHGDLYEAENFEFGVLVWDKRVQ